MAVNCLALCILCVIIVFPYDTNSCVSLRSSLEDRQDTRKVKPPTKYPSKTTIYVTKPNVVEEFLSFVSEIETNKENCSKGTYQHKLDRRSVSYGKKLYYEQALKTVQFANFYTRLWKTVVLDEIENGTNVFYSAVASLVENDPKIFAAGSCHDYIMFKNYTIFCPYAYRNPDNYILVKDLSIEYPYLNGNESEWFYQARVKGNEVAKDVSSRLSEATYRYRYNQTTHGIEVEADNVLVTYDDGYWSAPYYDCGGGNIWMMTYTVPFLGYSSNGSYYFKGTSGIDIDLRVIDINQCPDDDDDGEENIFANTHRCHRKSQECAFKKGLGFRRGSYKCVCKKGFYFPDIRATASFYNGSHMEAEYDKHIMDEPNNWKYMICEPCGDGCEECFDGRSCEFQYAWILRTILLLTQCMVTLLLLPLLIFTVQFREVKVVKAASPVILRIILLGALLLYFPVLVSYSVPTDFTCTTMQWFKEIGFATMFGALLLKTWRISVVFRVRSAARVRITDVDLMKRLGLIITGFVIYLTVRMFVSPPQAKIVTTIDELTTKQCFYDWWDYAANIAELTLLLWGVRLCYVVRKAPSEFNESRFISWAIYNETLITLFHTIATIFLQDLANPDVLYLVWFLYSQLTTTIVLALLFGSKIHLVLQGKGDKTSEARTMGGTSIGFRQRTWEREPNSTSSQGLMTFDGKALNQLDMQEELRRLYTQLELLKTKNMVAGNPHLSKKLTAMAEAARATEQILMDAESNPSHCSLETTYMLNGSGKISKVVNGDWT